MADQDQTRGQRVADDVAALLAEHAQHERRVDQLLAREQLAANRAVSTARRQDTRRKIIVGGAVLAEARTNPEFGTMLYEVLARRVLDPRDRTLIAEGPDTGGPPRSRAAPRASGAEGTAVRPFAAPGLPSSSDFAAMAEDRLAQVQADQDD